MPIHRCFDSGNARRPEAPICLAPPHALLSERGIEGAWWTPSYDGIRLFLGRPGLDVTARNPETWELLWSRAVPADDPNLPVEGVTFLLDGGSLVVGGESGLTVVDPEDGSTLSEHAIEAFNLSGAIAHGDLIVAELLADDAFHLAGFDLSRGALRYQRPLSGPVRFLTADRERVFVARPCDVTAYATQDGEELWRFAAGTAGVGRCDGRAVSMEDVLLVPARDPQHLLALDAATGEERWRRRGVVGHGRCFAGDVDGIVWHVWDTVAQIRASDGAVLREAPVASALREREIHTLHTLPVVSDTHLYVAGDRNIAAIRKDDLTIEWSFRSGEPLVPATGLVAMAGLLFVVTMDRHLFVLR